MKRPWTIKEQKFLRENFRLMSYVELAEKMDRSTRAITARLHALGLRKNKVWDSAAVDAVRSLAETNASYRQMGRSLGISEGSARNICIRFGIREKTRERKR